MAIDKNSNSFTFGFAIVMVVVVGVALAFSYQILKPPYDENVRKEKMQYILAAVNEDVDRSEAPAKFQEMLKEQMAVDMNGKVIQIEGDPFDLDIPQQYKEWKAGAIKDEDVKFPLFLMEQEGEPYFVMPLIGTGLWGPVWGYVSVGEDHNTVFGSIFAHAKETPGLGSEIATTFFSEQFKGKTIRDENGKYVSITVKKDATGDAHGVNGITGGTITSNSVDEMLKRCVEPYDKYFRSLE